MTFLLNLFKIIIFLIPVLTIGKTFQGKVTDIDTKEPVIGASIAVINTVKGTKTNPDGTFNLKDINSDSINVRISSVGYATKEITLTKEFTEIKLNPKNYRTNELVVTANKKVQSVQDVPISVSSISTEDINNRNITSLDYALQYVPGVEVNQDNVSIRGTSGFSFGVGSRVLLLQDGFPVLSADNNDIKFDIVPMLFIDRVEVVKGAGSALYGTSALGGVINVLTSKPSEEAVYRARVYSGVYDNPSFDSWQWTENPQIDNGVDLGYSQKFGKYGLLLHASLFNQNSYRQYDQTQRYSLYAKSNYDFNDYTSASLQLNYTNAETDDWVYWRSLRDPLIPPEGTNFDAVLQTNKFTTLAGLKHIIDEDRFINVKLGVFNTLFNNQLGDNNPEYRESTGNSVNLLSQYNDNISEDISLTSGIDIRYNTVNSVTYGTNDQLIYSLYTQGEFTNIDRLIITAGLRYDKEEVEFFDSSPQVNPKLGLNFKLNDRISLRGSYGRGFRAPSIAERFANVEFQGFRVQENTELEPEISNSVEFGTNVEILRDEHFLSLDFSGFFNSFDDLIEPTFIAGEGATIKFENITEAQIRGIESTIEYGYKNLINFRSSLTLLDPRDLTSNTDLKYRSDILWYNTLNINYLIFQIQADYRYKSRFGEIDERLALHINDHDARVNAHILDLRFSVLSEIFGIQGRTSIQVKNALNYYYLNMVGNMAPIRFANLQIELNI